MSKTPHTLWTLPLMCNVKTTLDLHNATGLNLMNDKKFKIISAWVAPGSGYYFIWYLDNKSNMEWVAYQDNYGSVLKQAVLSPLDYWGEYAASVASTNPGASCSMSEIQKATTAITRAFSTYYNLLRMEESHGTPV